MRIAVAGSKNWSNYNELIRQLTLIIEDHARERPEDKHIVFVHTGSIGAENMVTEYCGKVYSYLKQKGYHVKDQVFRPRGIDGRIVNKDVELLESDIDRAVVFIAAPSKRVSSFARLAEAYEIPTTIVRG